MIATVVAKPESVKELKSELLKMVVPTRSEDGCLSYTLNQDNEDPSVFIFHETWQSLASLEKHMASEHFSAYVKASEGLVARKTVHKLTLVDLK